MIPWFALASLCLSTNDWLCQANLQIGDLFLAQEQTFLFDLTEQWGEGHQTGDELEKQEEAGKGLDLEAHSDEKIEAQHGEQASEQGHLQDAEMDTPLDA